MHREVTALKTLEHKGIPVLLDSNTHKYESDTVLYFVQEQIEGITLEEKVKRNILPVNKAIILLTSLLKIIEFTHKKGEVHRDIKPDNIMLRNEKVNDPVLIDFGLTFNQKNVPINITPENQQLGNRFLALPELQLSSSNQRDPRSDLTQCMGIFLYSLTGIIPVTLFNEHEKFPHQRNNARQKLEEVIGEDNLKKYLSLFDRAFALKIDHRWQSVKEIIEKLNSFSDVSVVDETESEISYKEINNRIKSKVDYQERELVNKIWHKTYPIIRNTTHEIIDNLDKNYTQLGKGLGIDWEKLSFAEEQGIKNILYDDFRFKIRFIGSITGSEIVLNTYHNDEFKEVCRFPFNDSIDWSFVESSINSHYKKEFKAYLKKYSEDH